MAQPFDLLKFKKIATLAEAAPILDDLQTSRSQENLLLAITHPIADIKNDAVKRVQQIGDKQALPELIKALREANVPSMGSEHATAQKIYKENLIKAVSALSGQDFGITDINNPTELSETLTRMTRWADENL